MLLVLFPISFILGTVQVTVNTVAMRLVILPLTVVDVAICVDQPSFTICLIIFPPAFIHRAVRPYLTALALANVLALDPLSIVLGMVLQFDHSSVFNKILSVIRLLVIVELAELLSYLLHFGIIVVICNLCIGIVLVNAHIHLRYPDFFASQVTPYSCLYLNN